MAASMAYSSDPNVTRNTKAIRSCEEYLASWKDCAAWRNKFHEYYVHGEWPRCTQWKEDYNNCILWTTEQSQTAKNMLLQSEKERLMKHDDLPPVWKLRGEPYSVWNMPRTNNGARSSSESSSPSSQSVR